MLLHKATLLLLLSVHRHHGLVVLLAAHHETGGGVWHTVVVLVVVVRLLLVNRTAATHGQGVLGEGLARLLVRYLHHLIVCVHHFVWSLYMLLVHQLIWFSLHLRCWVPADVLDLRCAVVLLQIRIDTASHVCGSLRRVGLILFLLFQIYFCL